MSAMIGGSVVINGPLWGTDGLVIDTPQYRNAIQPEPYIAPNGVTWVSRGAYEQGEKLVKAHDRIKELEEKLADATFPVKGMSGCFDEDNGMDVWVAGKPGPNSLNFRMDKCLYCGFEGRSLHIMDDYADFCVCQSCLTKMFDVLGDRVFK